jgi:hypothetical protein
MRRSADPDGSHIRNLNGKLFTWQPARWTPGRRIASGAWYTFSNPEFIVGPDVEFVRWQVDGKGHSIVANTIREGERLDGKWGCFNVNKSVKLKAALLVRCNATDIYKLFVGQGEDQ